MSVKKTLEGGLRVLGKPDMCMFSSAATTEKINVYRLANEMKKKGWYLQPQFARENSPSNLHISMTRATVSRAEAFLKDFKETVEAVKHQPVDQKTLNLQKELKKLSLNYDDETFFKLAEMAGVTGTEAPQSMEKVNMLLEVLPYDVSEFMLTEYLNNMMVPERE